MTRIDLEVYKKECSCGKTHEIAVKGIWIEAGAISHLIAMLKDEVQTNGTNRTVIVCDDQIKAAVEEDIKELVNYCEKIVCLNHENLHANNHGVDMLEEEISKECTRLIALGAGTIHDLCRFVSSKHNLEFYSVPTAASVDGFVSTVAAMTWDGMKKTMPAKAPSYVFADTNLFKKAPYRLTASGISDLLGKYIALADWKISHIVTGEYICNEVITLEERALEEVVASIPDIRAGEESGYEKLMYALLLSGLAMQMIGNSRPASCAEHHMSHLWEMEIINESTDALHGEKVSVGMMLIVRKYKRIMKQIQSGKIGVKPYAGLEYELLQQTFGEKGLYESVIEENTPDPMVLVKPEILEGQLKEVARVLSEIPEEKQLEKLLRDAGCCYMLNQIGIDDRIAELSLQLSPYVRNRLSMNRLCKMLTE